MNFGRCTRLLRGWRALFALLLLLSCRASWAEIKPRYVGLLADGKRLAGDKLTDWYEDKALPKLDGQPLLEPGNPLRWLRDRLLPPAEPPAAYLEFHAGDRLPGVIVGVHPGAAAPAVPQPAYFLVRPAAELSPPSDLPLRELRILASAVRRIVWQRSARGPLRPGTAVQRSGAEVTFTSHRFGDDFVSLLSPEGQVRIGFVDLAELRLPSPPVWEQASRELAELVTRPETLLLQYETTDGLVVTASRERLAYRFDGNPVDSKRWVHGLQPAWSLDPLWVPCRNLALRRAWRPHEVPLPRLVSLAQNHAPHDFGLQHAQLNRSALGTPLRSAALDYGWGVGVHAPSRLTLPLPPHAAGFRTLATLDRLAGAGGCVRARVRLGPAASPVWESPVLVGSEAEADSGLLALAGAGSLILEADPVLRGRPPGADPLHVRDYLNWAEAVLQLPPPEVAQQLAARAPGLIPAWRDWRCTPPAGEGRLEVLFQRESRVEREEGFLPAVRVLGGDVVLQRTQPLSADDEWLVAAVAVAGDCNPRPLLKVLIDGQLAAEWPAPTRATNREDNRPLAVRLAPFRKGTKPVTIEVRQTACAANTPPTVWRSLAVSRRLPIVVPLVPRAVQAVALAPELNGSATASVDSLGAVIRLLPAGRFRLPLGETFAIRERPAWGEYRFLRFAVKKQGKGRVAVECQPVSPRSRPLRYDLGRGKSAYDSAIRIWEGDLPASDWVTVTRDLYADFGQFELDALVLGAPDGEWAEVKLLQLARKPDDFDLLPQK